MESMAGSLVILRVGGFGTGSGDRQARGQERRSGGELKISLAVDGDLQGLPPTAAAHVYRIVQEGLTNIGKHAKAGRARVSLSLAREAEETAEGQPQWLALTIEDDGCGGVDRSKATEGEGLGLIGMRERVMALGVDGRSDFALAPA